MHANANNSKLLKIACGIARADFDLARESNHFDRMAIISNAAMLVLLGILACLAWSAFWASFLPVGAAIPLGMLVGLIVFLIDQAIAASDWEMAGILRIAPPSKSYCVKIAARALIAFFLANATATGATLWMFGATIDSHLHAKRISNNSAVESEYEQRKAELAIGLEPLSNEIMAKQLERNKLVQLIEAAIVKRDEANVIASDALIEEERQLGEGGALPGYTAGDGPKWRDAKRQRQEATNLAKSASDNITTWLSRKSSLDDSIANLNATLNSQQAEYQSQLLLLEEKKINDPRWIPYRNDPLMRYLALEEILHDPEFGAAATKFYWMMTLVLLTLELSFLLIKVVCSPASVYMVSLIARTKRDAAAVSIEFARSIDAVRRNHPRGNLRVVGGEPVQPEGEQ